MCDGVNYDKRFYINTHLTNQSGDDCASAITRDWHTRNKSVDSLEKRPDSSKLNAESSSRLCHGNKKYFLLRWKNPWMGGGDPLAVDAIENRASISSL